ncbi:unnamed protein product [Enterobius vermicularis]|uniref:AA_permease domain-containing protein n=1 Tax=Enterobius vermicularis TaxID=51028 RepID=A0A0N4USQ4_ENTVE|nr:unnamed protein product [Enterobius vermicularis]
MLDGSNLLNGSNQFANTAVTGRITLDLMGKNDGNEGATSTPNNKRGDQNDSIGYADQEKLAGNQEKTKFLFRRMLFKKSVDGKKTADLAEKPLLNYSVDGTPAVIQSRKDSFFDLSLASVQEVAGPGIGAFSVLPITSVLKMLMLGNIGLRRCVELAVQTRWLGVLSLSYGCTSHAGVLYVSRRDGYTEGIVGKNVCGF